MQLLSGQSRQFQVLSDFCCNLLFLNGNQDFVIGCGRKPCQLLDCNEWSLYDACSFRLPVADGNYRAVRSTLQLLQKDFPNNAATINHEFRSRRN